MWERLMLFVVNKFIDLIWVEKLNTPDEIQLNWTALLSREYIFTIFSVVFALLHNIRPNIILFILSSGGNKRLVLPSN